MPPLARDLVRPRVIAASVLVVPSHLEESFDPDTVPYSLLEQGEVGEGWFEESRPVPTVDLDELAGLEPCYEETLIIRGRRKKKVAGSLAGIAGLGFLSLLGVAAVSESAQLPSTASSRQSVSASKPRVAPSPPPAPSRAQPASAAAAGKATLATATRAASSASEPGRAAEERAAVASESPRKTTKRGPRSGSRTRRPARRTAQEVEATGTLSLGAKPPCRIYVDGRYLGMTPKRDLRLAPGTHRVTLRSEDGAVDKTYSVPIRAGQSTRLIRDFMAD